MACGIPLARIFRRSAKEQNQSETAPPRTAPSHHDESSKASQRQFHPPQIEVHMPAFEEYERPQQEGFEPQTPNALTTPTRTRSSRRNSDTSSNRSKDSNATNASQLNQTEAFPTEDNSLKDKLRKVRRECPQHAHTYLIPKDAQEHLITVESVANDIRAGNPQIKEKVAITLATESCKSARKLYATLAYIKKGAEIGPLLAEGLTDKDLPLDRKFIRDDHEEFTLSRVSGKPIDTFQNWRNKDLEKFDRTQWWIIAPVFEEQEHYILHDNTILPFVPFELSKEKKEPKQGGYSEVYPVRIHPAHHKFWDHCSVEKEEPLVAVKELFSSEDEEFQKEVTILKALGSKQKKHPHLIKLLATYKHQRKYHLMFPYANSNLRDYWDARPNPVFDKATILWSLKQMTGFASALDLIHNFEVAIPLLVPGPGQKRVQPNAELSVRGGEELFGRHGDIKPENILWFQKSPDTDDEGGVLQIADFGLGRFHGRDSRSKVAPESIFASPTYEPPECKLRRPVSRAYDLWSLGCLYLEFVTWLLKGSAEIEGFSNFRGKLATSTQIDDDNFFTIIKDATNVPEEAVVREEVISWVAQLHEHNKCSALIHDLLDLTMDKLLVTDSGSRIEARWLFQNLNSYLIRASKDTEYLLRPVPWKNETKKNKPLKPISSLPKPSKTKGRNVSFSDQRTCEHNKLEHLSKSLPSTSKDLLLRKAETTRFGHSKNKLASSTWPQVRPL